MKDTGKYEAYEKMISCRDKAENINIWKNTQATITTYEQEIEMEWAEYFFKGDREKVYQDIRKVLIKIDINQERENAEQFKKSLNVESADFVSKNVEATFYFSIVIHLLYLKKICNNGEDFRLAREKIVEIVREIYQRKLGETFTLISTTSPTRIIADMIDYTRKTTQKNKPYGYNGLRRWGAIRSTSKGDIVVETKRRTVEKHEEAKAIIKQVKQNNTETEFSAIYTNMESFIEKAPESVIKIFLFVLGEANRKIYDQKSGILRSNTLTFDLQEFVDCGMFKSLRGAKEQFLSAMSALRTLEFQYRNVVIRKRKNRYGNFSTEEGTTGIFGDARVKDGRLAYVIFCDSDIRELKKDFSFLMKQYIPFPCSAFSLTYKSFKLLWYIFCQARQEHNTMTVETIRVILNLPSVSESGHIYRDILKPIEEAIGEIEEMYGENIKFYPSENLIEEKGKRKEQVTNGVYTFELSEAFMKPIQKIEAKKKQVKERNIKKSESRKKQ